MSTRLSRSIGLAGAIAAMLAALAVPASAGPSGGDERVAVIVTLADGVGTDRADDVAGDHGAELGFIYSHVLGGFSARVPQQRMAGLRNDRRVAAVEVDRVMTTQAQQRPTGIPRVDADEVVAVPETSTLLINDSDDYRVDVDIAIVDTGIDRYHEDLHVVGGTDCSGGSPFKKSCSDGTFADGHGHGTHVAGTAAALDNAIGVVGVAPGARLWGVKVLSDSGSGYTSWIIAGIEWVVAKSGTADHIEVLNMSLGGSGVSESYRTAIDDAVAKQVTVVVAAGNSSADASNYSPAYVPSAITVSALADSDGLAGGGMWDPTACRTDQEDTFADFSNFGNSTNGDPIDLIAPGVCILSTVPGNGYATYSGTSMSSPHVAGAAALLRSAGKTHIETESSLKTNANPGWDDVDDPDPTKEGLLDVTGFVPKLTAVTTDGGGGTANNPPTASFTYSCTDLTCDFDGSGSSDQDADALTYAWDFGDGNSGAGSIANHSYGSGGTYTVTLTVNDGSATDSESKSVSVTAPSSGGISLTVTAYKVKGYQNADLTWSETPSTHVDVYRDGAVVVTTADDGAYTDSTGAKGGGSAIYKVCEAGTTTCSNEATATW